MIDAIIFDIGNVLLLFDYERALQRLQPFCEADLNAANHEVRAAIEPEKIAYESGEIDRAQFLKTLFALLGYRGSEEKFVAIWQDIFMPNAPMVTLVEALHKRLPLYLLSNIGDIHTESIFHDFAFFRWFRDGVYSYRTRSFKPDPAIFQIAIRQFGVDPAKTLYIDDLARNAQGAAACGFQAIAYDFKRHDAFLETLARHGVAFDEEAR